MDKVTTYKRKLLWKVKTTPHIVVMARFQLIAVSQHLTTLRSDVFGLRFISVRHFPVLHRAKCLCKGAEKNQLLPMSQWPSGCQRTSSQQSYWKAIWKEVELVKCKTIPCQGLLGGSIWIQRASVRSPPGFLRAGIPAADKLDCCVDESYQPCSIQRFHTACQLQRQMLCSSNSSYVPHID